MYVCMFIWIHAGLAVRVRVRTDGGECDGDAQRPAWRHGPMPGHACVFFLVNMQGEDTGLMYPRGDGDAQRLSMPGRALRLGRAKRM